MARLGKEAWLGGTAELIFTGDELLRGDIVNSNQAFLGEELLELGLFVDHALSRRRRHAASSPTPSRTALRPRPEVLLLSGGLGPTEDDLTREAVALALDRPLVYHEDLMAQIEDRFQVLGLRLSDTQPQAGVHPRGRPGRSPSRARHRDSGSWRTTSWWQLCPGVPRELRHMWVGDPRAPRHAAPSPDWRRGRSPGPAAAHRGHGRVGARGSPARAALAGQRTLRRDPGASIDGLTLILRSDAHPRGRAASGGERGLRAGRSLGSRSSAKGTTTWPRWWAGSSPAEA